MKIDIKTLRALAVATNSLRYDPEIDPDEVAAYENLLIRLWDSLSEERQRFNDKQIYRQIDRPCGACAYCGYSRQIERKSSHSIGNKVTVRQYFYCGLTCQELTREQAFYESRCAHWKMCAQLETARKEKTKDD